MPKMKGEETLEKKRKKKKYVENQSFLTLYF